MTTRFTINRLVELRVLCGSFCPNLLLKLLSCRLSEGLGIDIDLWHRKPRHVHDHRWSLTESHRGLGVLPERILLLSHVDRQ